MTLVELFPDGDPDVVVPLAGPRGKSEPCGKLLDEVHAFVTKYVAFPTPEAADAVTLWIMHTHAFDAAETTPRLSIQSAEKQSGKTRLMEVLDLLTQNPLQTASISSAAMFRVIEEEPVTLLIDEVDTVFTKRGGGKEDLRGLLNAGYRRGSSVIRAAGTGIERYKVFAPAALAGIGRLPDTVEDRSIVIRMKRRTSSEPITKLRNRDAETPAALLRDRLAEWARVNVGRLALSSITPPAELGDRAADIWEPLLAIAQKAGGTWPKRARAAAIECVGKGGGDALSTGVRLLTDLRRAFHELEADRAPTAELLHELHALDASPWVDLDARSLASTLKPFDIAPKVVRDGDNVFRGYLLRDFHDAFARYIPEA